MTPFWRNNCKEILKMNRPGALSTIVLLILMTIAIAPPVLAGTGDNSC